MVIPDFETGFCMQVALNELYRGLKIPLGFSVLATRLAAVLLASLLAALIFRDKGPGSIAALVFLLPLVAIARDWQKIRLHRQSLFLLCVALLSIAGVALEPGFLNLTMSWAMLSALAVTLHLGDGLTSLQTLGAIFRNYLKAPGHACRRLAPVEMLEGAKKAWGGRSLAGLSVGALALPIVAVVVFGGLLITANPVLENFARKFDIVSLIDLILSRGLVIFVLAFALLWPLLHVAVARRPEAHTVVDQNSPAWHRLFFRPATVALTLLLLNGMFGFENLLDLWNVWLVQVLPGDYSHAEYVHRGAYTLVVTAILAALLMIFALWPHSATAKSVTVQRLVYLWMGQNLLLLGSSAKRTLSYVNAYGWTEWRLAGLIWMGLVGFGLATIIWRVWLTRDNKWLINANLVAAAVLLVVCGLMDFRGRIADWNVDRNLANSSASLDLNYMGRLGETALPALYRLRLVFSPYDYKNSRKDIHSIDTIRASRIINDLEHQVRMTQRNWQSWTWRYSDLLALGARP